MYELLLRTETLFLGLKAPVLLGVGLPALAAGLVLWLVGTRYSTVIIGLLGAVVGAAIGLLVGQWLELHLWLSMLIGAAVLATASVLLRNVLILVLAVLVIAAVSGAGYLAIVLDRMAPPPPPEPEAPAGYAVPVQSFSSMDQTTRLSYMDEISGEEQTFSDRLRALLDNTWQAVRPHAWKFVLSVVAGGLIAVFFVWLIKKAFIPLAYSVVGTATVFIGAQAALLGVGFPAVSALDARPWLLPTTFVSMTVFGWLFQLVSSRPKPRKQPEKKAEESRPAD